MPQIELIKHFLEQASAKLFRTSTLAPIAWLISILIAGIFTSAYFKNPEYITISFLIFCGAVILLYLIAYIYFMLKNPDALRSEKYVIQKLAIKKGLVGDSLQGLFRMKETSQEKIAEIPQENKEKKE